MRLACCAKYSARIAAPLVPIFDSGSSPLWESCMAVRDGRKGSWTWSPNASGSCSIWNVCSAVRGELTLFTMIPAKTRSGLRYGAAWTFSTVCRDSATPQTEYAPGSVTTVTRSAAMRPLRVSRPRAGGRSMRTWSYTSSSSEPWAAALSRSAAPTRLSVSMRARSWEPGTTSMPSLSDGTAACPSVPTSPA